ncbi:unnamed protein product [Ectocarpus sp. 12 AP-2014]
MAKELDCKRWLYHPRMAHYLESHERNVEKFSYREDSPQFQVQKQNHRPSQVIPSVRKSVGSGMYRNDRGEYLFYCRRCNHQVFLNARQCFCELCSGVMYRIHRDQVNARNL